MLLSLTLKSSEASLKSSEEFKLILAAAFTLFLANQYLFYTTLVFLNII